jgi:hypothetical protein
VSTAPAAFDEDLDPESAPANAMAQSWRRADEAARDELAGRVKDEIAKLVELCHKLPEGLVRCDGLKDLHRTARDVRALGAAAGYWALTEIARSLCLLLSRIVQEGDRARMTPLRKAAIAMHVRNLSHIEKQARTGSGGDAGARLVAGLRAVAEKASA